jgi:hypothetical protein
MSVIATTPVGQFVASATPVSVSAAGRTTTGDNGGGRQSAAVKAARVEAAAQIAPARTVTATTMGPSGYRAEHGVLTDEQLIAAVRASFAPSEVPLTDAQIVDAIGWTLTAGTAIAKVTALLTA